MPSTFKQQAATYKQQALFLVTSYLLLRAEFA